MLPAGVLVHIHDIFIPFDYPDNYFERFYTEEYLLHALLAHSTKFEVVLATHYLAREYREAMQAVFGPGVGAGPPHQNRQTGTNGGSGIWRESELLRHIIASFHDVFGRFSYHK